MQRPALIRRIPTLRPPTSSPPLPTDAAGRFPQAESDLGVLQEELFPSFAELDRAALRSQHSFRLAQLLLILGGLIATLLGVVQAALPHSRWAGIAEAILVAFLAALFGLSRDLNFKQDYLDQRLKAERMRSECFLYLARAGEYNNLGADASRTLLHRRVALITTGKANNA